MIEDMLTEACPPKDIFLLKGRKNSMRNLDVSLYCNAAKVIASVYKKNFAFKPKDIDDIEEILEFYHKDYVNKTLDEELMYQIVGAFGIYLGQVMLQTGLSSHGYKWEYDDGQPCLSNKVCKLFPISKIQKRIVYGKGDDVSLFYRTTIEHAKNNFVMWRGLID